MSASAITSSAAFKTLIEDGERHLVRSVAEAPLTDDPFPYFYAADVFSPALYAEMVAQLPARRLYKNISETGRSSGEYEKRLILHMNAPAAGLTDAQNAFWRGIVGMLAGSAFASAILKKFAATLERDLGRDPRELEYGTEVLLVKDLDGYVIGPHTDIKSRAVSIMFYMPSSPRYEPYGTAIYRPTQPGVRSDGSRHFGFDGFTRLATMPCRANSMFAFQRNDVSFHGVEQIAEPDCERDVLLYILRWFERAVRA